MYSIHKIGHFTYASKYDKTIPGGGFMIIIIIFIAIILILFILCSLRVSHYCSLTEEENKILDILAKHNKM